MKKFIIFFGVAALISFSSCQKERTCKCTTVTDGASVESVVIVKGEKCNSLDSESSIGGVTIKVTCIEE